MRPRTLLVLFVLVIGLGSFIWFFERDLPSTEERVEQGKKLVRLDLESVRGIELKGGGRQIRLERVLASGKAGDAGDVGDGYSSGDELGEWALTEPRAARGDADEVRRLLERVRDLEKERTLEDVSRDGLGLDRPRGQIKIETGSEDLVLRFGGEIPASSNTIVEVGNGPPFYVVSGSLVDDVVREPNEWRSRDAIPIDRSRIERIEVLNPPTGVALERAEGGFRLVAPRQDVADEDRVASLLTALVDLEIEEFVDHPDADLGAEPLALRLTLADSAAPMLVEIAASPSGEELVAVRVDGQVFKADTDLVSLLAQRPEEWQSGSWSDRDAFEVEAFRVVHNGDERRFERREGEWLSEDVEVEYSNVSAFLYAVAGAKGVPVDLTPGSAGELAEMEIELESEGWTESLRLWADGDGYLAERNGRATPVRLAPESIDELFAKLEALQPASEPAAELTP